MARYLQLEQSPLHEHLTISLAQTGTHDYDTLVKEKSCGEETTNCVCALVVQIPA